MFTIRPNRPRIMGRAAARAVMNTERRFTAMTSSKSASLILRMSPSRVIPALLTRMSRRPCVEATSSISSVISSL